MHGSDIIDVCRGGGVYETIRTEELVPGDMIILPANGCTMHCDAVLLFGTCIVNESMLTGKHFKLKRIRNLEKQKKRLYNHLTTTG